MVVVECGTVVVQRFCDLVVVVSVLLLDHCQYDDCHDDDDDDDLLY